MLRIHLVINTSSFSCVIFPTKFWSSWYFAFRSSWFLVCKDDIGHKWHYITICYLKFKRKLADFPKTKIQECFLESSHSLFIMEDLDKKQIPFYQQTFLWSILDDFISPIRFTIKWTIKFKNHAIITFDIMSSFWINEKSLLRPFSFNVSTILQINHCVCRILCKIAWVYNILR